MIIDFQAYCRIMVRFLLIAMILLLLTQFSDGAVAPFFGLSQISSGGVSMPNNDFNFSVPDPNSKYQRFKTLRYDPELLQIEDIFRNEQNLWEDEQVQQKFRLAKFGTDEIRKKKRIELWELIEDYKALAMQLDDSFMPYATAEQISNGDQGIHILNQAHNNIPFMAAPYSYALLWLILGPQGGGKSSALFYQLQQFDVPIIIFDPKGTWEFRAEQLSSEIIPPEYLSFDFKLDDEDKLPMYLFSIMEGVAYATGLQYGLSPLMEAGDIALEQRKRYIEQPGEKTPLCLKDIQIALNLCDSKKFKRSQYVESARTALDLLVGKDQLFTTRSGLPLDTLFDGNYTLQCRYATATQSRFLGWFLLNYLYFQSLHLPETTQLQRIIVFEDSSKFISKPDSIFGAGPQTSIWLHLLSVLRSTGTGIIFIDQLVEPICDDVKQLCNNWLVVGGMRGIHNQDEVASAMGLTPEQADMLGRLQQREAVVFCPSTYPHAIHGYIPEVQAL